MLRTVVNICMLVSVLTVIGVFSYFMQAPMIKVPLPYIGPEVEVPSFKANPNVLFIGDRMAKSLYRFAPQLKSQLLKKKGLEITTELISDERDGLHRTLAKLRKLPKLPPFIVYHGASSEMVEKKLLINQYSLYKENFRRYQDDTYSSLILTAPWTSKFLYKKYERVRLTTPPTPNKEDIPGAYRMKEYELSYLYFEYELSELVELALSKGSRLILTTTPINYFEPPKKVCALTNTKEVEDFLENLEKIKSEGDIKIYVRTLEDLAKSAPSNALIFYKLGVVHKQLRNYAKSNYYFKMSTALDCDISDGNMVYNSIIQRMAKRYALPLLDFHAILQQHITEENPFQNELYPDTIHYQNMMDLIFLEAEPLIEI